MSKRPTPTVALTLALGICAAHCGNSQVDSFTLDCNPTMPTVGDDVTLTLDFDIESLAAPFQWRDTSSLGAFAQPTTPPPVNIGTVMNTFTPDMAGETSVEVVRDGAIVAACILRVQSRPTFEVSVSVNGMGTVTVNGDACTTACQQQVAEGDTVELIATPDTGWRFDAWSGDCAQTTSSTVTLTVDAAVTCGATFIERAAPGADQVVVPAGTFRRGCSGLPNCPGSETPVRDITLTRFAIDRTEVTVADYRACVDATVCTEPVRGTNCNYFEMNRNTHPVNCVTWTQADTYCTFRNKRLPTEAEWEMAARGTMDERRYPWGDEPADCNRGNYFSVPDGMSCAGNSTMPVGSYPTGASPSGALDMAGNVFEWVADWFVADYYDPNNSPDMNPPGPPMGDAMQRVRRGGSFRATSEAAFVFARNAENPDTSTAETGFRCARTF